jgi:hypothetical protein
LYHDNFVIGIEKSTTQERKFARKIIIIIIIINPFLGEKGSKRKRIKEITNKYLEESFDLIRQAQHGVFANDLDDEYKGSNLEFQLMKILLML